MTKPTVPDAIMTTGWSKGIAAQVSLPNILLPSLRRSGRHVTRRDPIEQTLAHPRVGLRSLGLGGPRQLLECVRVKGAALGLRGIDPVLEGLRFGGHKVEAHVGKAVAAELRREPFEG